MNRTCSPNSSRSPPLSARAVTRFPPRATSHVPPDDESMKAAPATAKLAGTSTMTHPIWAGSLVLVAATVKDPVTPTVAVDGVTVSVQVAARAIAGRAAVIAKAMKAAMPDRRAIIIRRRPKAPGARGWKPPRPGAVRRVPSRSR